MTDAKPILFSGPMVRAILAGTKTQTRRVVKRPLKHLGWTGYMMTSKKDGAIECGPDYPDDDTDFVACPYGAPGSKLWIRETWCHSLDGTGRKFRYKSDYGTNSSFAPAKWNSSRFMPRLASRITLEITNVQVERLQDISRDDALAEGMPFQNHCWKDEFHQLWDAINGKKYPWSSNPFVWKIEFRRCTTQAVSHSLSKIHGSLVR